MENNEVNSNPENSTENEAAGVSPEVGSSEGTKKGPPKSAIIAIVAVVILVGVGYFFMQRSSEAPTTPSEPIVVEYVSALFVGDELRTGLIKELGIDKRHGVDIQYNWQNVGEVERVFREGAGDMGGFSFLQYAKDISNGQDFRLAYAELQGMHYLTVPVDSPINSPADLVGKKLALLPKGSAGHNTWKVTMNEYGVDLDTEVQLLFGIVPDIMRFLTEGEVDAAMLPFPPVASLLASDEYRVIGKMEDFWQEKVGRRQPFVTTIVRNSFYEEHPEAVDGVRKAYFEVGQMIKDNPELISGKTELLESMFLFSPAEQQLVAENYPKDVYTEWNQSVIDDLNFLKDKAVEVGLLVPVDLNPFYIQP